MTYYFEQLARLEVELKVLQGNYTSIYTITDKGLKACQRCLTDLRARVLKDGFKSLREESIFFKEIKPKIVGYMFFFLNLVELEQHTPLGTYILRRKVVLRHIERLRCYFHEHREFYEYYMRGHSHRDEAYFTRDADSPQLHFDFIVAMVDMGFTTSHDMLLARIIGNDLTIAYLERALEGNGAFHIRSGQEELPALTWTGAKVDLVELVYALQACGMVNNGQATLAELAKAIAYVFDRELGDYYRTFLEIRGRKTQPTKLLDMLKRSLLNKMEEADG